MCQRFFTPIVEFVSAELSKAEIEAILFNLGPDVHVTGSRITEDGYDLVLEGPAPQVLPCIYAMEQLANERMVH